MKCIIGSIMPFKSFPFLLVLALGSIHAQTIRIALVGDSTVQNESGWGPGFTASFGTPGEVANAARGGGRVNSLFAEKAWVPVPAVQPPTMLLCLGHNDDTCTELQRQADP